MKKSFYALFALLLLLPVGASAQVKVVDKSAKKAPTWVNSSETEYIVTSAIKDDLEAAKNQCLDNVRKYIIESVAENVKASSEGTINQQIVNSEIVSFLDAYKSTYQTQAADVPFLKGISASRIEAYYWEKREDKATKNVTYLYAIKYPFPSVELKRMTHEFEKRDKEIWGRYERLAGQLDDVRSVEQIDRAIADLGPVIGYLFDDTRKNQAKALQQSYRKLYDNITFRTISNKLGEYRFSLVLDDRVITTSQRITLKSECATQLASEHRGEEIAVTYAYDGCAYDEENAVTASFRLDGKTVPHKFFFTVKKYEVAVWPEKTIYLTSKEKSDSTLTSISIRIPIKNEQGGPVVITDMTLQVPGLSEPLFLDGLNTTVSAKESTLSLTWIGEVELLRKQNVRLNMLRGNMMVEVPAEGITKRIDFSTAFQANW